MVRDLIPSINRSCSTGDGCDAIQPPLARISPITFRLKITSRAMPARFLLAVVDAAPSINGVMMLLSCARIVVDASYFLGQNTPRTNADNAITAKIAPSARRRRFASLNSAGNIAPKGASSPLISIP